MKNNQRKVLVIIHVGFSIYIIHYIGILLRKVNVDVSDKQAFVTVIASFSVIILRIVLVWLFFYYVIEKTFRKREAKKHGFCSFQSKEIWIDHIPGSRNGTIFLFSFLNFSLTIEGISRFFNELYYDRLVLDWRVSVVHILTTRKYLFLIIIAIVNILISIGSSFLFYWNRGGGSNFFDKKKGVVYITRYGIPGEGRFRVWKIKIKEISCLILVVDTCWGDVLYLKTSEGFMLELTPINGNCYSLSEKAVELSRFLSVPLIISRNKS
jgi:hypothetical protein